jgi:hypothetical protein
MKSVLYTLLLLLPIVGYSQKDLSRFHIEGVLGLNIGAPIPDDVGSSPSGTTGAPGAKIAVGFISELMLDEKISFSSGLLLSTKGATFSGPMEGKFDIAKQVLGDNFPLELNVNINGEIEGQFSNTYLDVPLFLTYQANRKWAFSAGYQYSRLQKAQFNGTADIKLLIINLRGQEWDESDLIAKNDHALLAGMKYNISRKVSANLQFNYAMTKLFEEESADFPNPRNIYMKLMVGYRLF